MASTLQPILHCQSEHFVWRRDNAKREPARRYLRRHPSQMAIFERRAMKIAMPDFCLVALIVSSEPGKSAFARRHFRPTDAIFCDTCRGFGGG